MDKIIVVMASLTLSYLIIWWFFMKPKDGVVSASEGEGVQTIDILVDGGYQPRVISLKKDVPAVLNFYRKDSSACLNEVVFPDFGVSRKLPLGVSEQIKIDPKVSGEFQYYCGMQMFSGTVVVK